MNLLPLDLLESKVILALRTVGSTDNIQSFWSSKLDSMGIEIDQLTAEQRRYMSGWEQGT
jgi:hypothetical protein